MKNFAWKCFILDKRIATHTNASRFLCRHYNKFGFMMKNLSNRFFPVSFQIFFFKNKIAKFESRFREIVNKVSEFPSNRVSFCSESTQIFSVSSKIKTTTSCVVICVIRKLANFSKYFVDFLLKVHNGNQW